MAFLKVLGKPQGKYRNIKEFQQTVRRISMTNFTLNTFEIALCKGFYNIVNDIMKEQVDVYF